MAKGQYKKWLEPDNLILLEGWKRNGLTDQQIADNIGINRRTLDKWKSKYGRIGHALKMGHEAANYAVEGKLFRKAIQGNTTAMIFWLKNNWRDKYNDSELSPEERKLAMARIRKTNAELQRIEAETKRLNSNDDGITKIVFSDDLKPDKEDDTDQEGDESSGAKP